MTNAGIVEVPPRATPSFAGGPPLQVLQAAVDDFCKHAGHGGLAVLDEDEFTDVAREVEAIRRQLAAADYPIIAEIDARALPDIRLTRNAAGFLRRSAGRGHHQGPGCVAGLATGR